MKQISAVPTLALSALALALTGCAGLQAPQVGDGELRLSGELTTRSGVNFNSGSRYQTFPLRLRAGEALQVRQSGDLDAQMALLDARNTLVAGPASGSLTLAPTQDGIYTLGVSGMTTSDYGPFGLSLKRIEVRNSGELVQGEHLAGLLSATVPGNEYQLPITQPGIYTLDMVSTEFDSVLRLQGNDLKLENDDYGSGLDSRIETYLEPGSYQVRAGALEQASGAYTLTVGYRPVPSDVLLKSSGLLADGENVTGLTSMVPASYTIEVPQAAAVRLAMNSSEVDSVLALSGNQVELADDDSGGGENALLQAFLQPGTYVVQAQSIDQRAGLFTLAYSMTPVARGTLTQLEPGQYVQGRLEAGTAGKARLKISEAGRYIIDLASADFDAFLRVSGGETVAEDDDSGGSYNARLALDLEPGEYELRVTAAGTPESGRFVIWVGKDS